MTLRGVQQLCVGDAEIDVLVVMPILYVLQKPLNHGRRDHVSDSLRNVAAVTLEGDADDLAILHYRSAAIARIDLGADLDRQVLVYRRVGIKLEVDARNNAGGYR